MVPFTCTDNALCYLLLDIVDVNKCGFVLHGQLETQSFQVVGCRRRLEGRDQEAVTMQSQHY